MFSSNLPFDIVEFALQNYICQDLCSFRYISKTGLQNDRSHSFSHFCIVLFHIEICISLLFLLIPEFPSNIHIDQAKSYRTKIKLLKSKWLIMFIQVTRLFDYSLKNCFSDCLFCTTNLQAIGNLSS